MEKISISNPKLTPKYKKDVLKIIDILNKTGASLYKQGKIIDYGLVRMIGVYHHGVSDEFLNEHPAVNAFFEFSDSGKKNFIVLSAKLDRAFKHSFDIIYQIRKNLSNPNNLANQSISRGTQCSIHYAEKEYNLEYTLDELIKEKKR